MARRFKLTVDDDLVCWRNSLAVVLSNWILRHIATPGYRDRVTIFIRAGIEDVYGQVGHGVTHDIIRAAHDAGERT